VKERLIERASDFHFLDRELDLLLNRRL